LKQEDQPTSNAEDNEQKGCDRARLGALAMWLFQGISPTSRVSRIFSVIGPFTPQEQA
jgi:hypothetical protein